MKRIVFFTLLVVMVFGVSHAEMTRYDVNVGDFNRLAVSADINVVYRCNPDSAGHAVFVTDVRRADVVMFSNNSKGQLTISLSSEARQLRDLPVVTVFSSYLTEVHNAGDSALVIASLLPRLPNLKVRLSDNGSVDVPHATADNLELHIITGKGRITAAGECAKLTITNLGKGEVNAAQVTARDVSCRITGTGNVYCRLYDGVLDVKGAGTGKVYYYGKPKKVKMLKLGSIEAIAVKD